jgi:hypothetical protein
MQKNTRIRDLYMLLGNQRILQILVMRRVVYLTSYKNSHSIKELLAK